MIASPALAATRWDALGNVGLGLAGLPVRRQLEVRLVAAGYAGETAGPGRHVVQLEGHRDQAVVEVAVVVAVVALAAVGGSDQIGRPARALAAAVQVEHGGVGGAVDLDVVVVEPVVRPEQRLQVGRDAGQVDQVDVGAAPLDQRLGGERRALPFGVPGPIRPEPPLPILAPLLQPVGQVGHLGLRQGVPDHEVAAKVEQILLLLGHVLGLSLSSIASFHGCSFVRVLRHVV